MQRGPHINAVEPAPSVAPIDAVISLARIRARAAATAPRLGGVMLDVRPRRSGAIDVSGAGIAHETAAIFKLPLISGDGPHPERGPEAQAPLRSAPPAASSPLPATAAPLQPSYGSLPAGMVITPLRGSAGPSPLPPSGLEVNGPALVFERQSPLGVAGSTSVDVRAAEPLRAARGGAPVEEPLAEVGEVWPVRPLEAARDEVPRSPEPRGGAEGDALMPLLPSLRKAIAPMGPPGGQGAMLSPLPARAQPSPNVVGIDLTEHAGARRDPTRFEPLGAARERAAPAAGEPAPNPSLETLPERELPLDALPGMNVASPDIDALRPPVIHVRDSGHDAVFAGRTVEGPTLIERTAPSTLPARTLDGLAGPLIQLVRREVSDEVARAAEQKPPPAPPPPPARPVDVESDDFVRGLMSRMASMARDERFRSGRLR